MKISNFKLGIACPLNFPMVPSAFFDSFISMEKPDYTYLRSSEGPIEGMRNDIAVQAIRLGLSHLIMMDTDQVYHPLTITRLLSHRLPFVGCLVYRRYPPFDPLLMRGQVDGYSTITEWEPDSLVEVDATGGGCVCFDMEIFRTMPYPWFRFRVAGSGAPIGEDFGLCADLKQRGYRLYVDTSVPADHLTKLAVNGATWKLYRKLKDAEVRAAHEVEHGVLATKA